MKNLFIITAVAASLLASCSNEDSSVNNNSNYLKVQVNGINTKSIKTTFSNPDLINVFIIGTGYTPVLTGYKYNGTSWAVNGTDKDIALTGNGATVYAYYPASLNPAPALSTSGTLPVAIPVTDDIAATNTTDVLWATPVVQKNNKTAGTSNLATLLFNHALAKISFIIVKDATYPSDATSGVLNQISITSAGAKIVNVGTVNVSTGTFTAGNLTTASLVYTPATVVNINQTANPGAVTAYALVAPVNYTGADLVLKMTIDGKTMAVPNFPQNPDWSAANKDYQYTITVKPTSLSVTATSSITDWTATAAGTGTAL